MLLVLHKLLCCIMGGKIWPSLPFYSHWTTITWPQFLWKIEQKQKRDLFGEWGFLHIYCMKGQQCDDEEQIVLAPQTTHCCDHNIEALKATSKAACFPLLYWVYDVNTKLAARDLHNQSCIKAECMVTPTKQAKLDFQQVQSCEKNVFLGLYAVLWKTTR